MVLGTIFAVEEKAGAGHYDPADQMAGQRSLESAEEERIDSE